MLFCSSGLYEAWPEAEQKHKLVRVGVFDTMKEFAQFSILQFSGISTNHAFDEKKLQLKK